MFIINFHYLDKSAKFRPILYLQISNLFNMRILCFRSWTLQTTFIKQDVERFQKFIILYIAFETNIEYPNQKLKHLG